MVGVFHANPNLNLGESSTLDGGDVDDSMLKGIGHSTQA
jgi:hypothetical protein